jgi:hypothetical protein
MSTLPVQTEDSLMLSGESFNADNLCAVFVCGTRAGGDWIMNVMLTPYGSPIGSFWARRVNGLSPDDTRFPGMANRAAFGWLRDQARARGWRLLGWEDMNDKYGPGERPFFTLAQAVLGSASFVPEPGVQYADETIA